MRSVCKTTLSKEDKTEVNAHIKRWLQLHVAPGDNGYDLMTSLCIQLFKTCHCEWWLRVRNGKAVRYLLNHAYVVFRSLQLNHTSSSWRTPFSINKPRIYLYHSSGRGRPIRDCSASGLPDVCRNDVAYCSPGHHARLPDYLTCTGIMWITALLELILAASARGRYYSKHWRVGWSKAHAQVLVSYVIPKRWNVVNIHCSDTSPFHINIVVGDDMAATWAKLSSLMIST